MRRTLNNPRAGPLEDFFFFEFDDFEVGDVDVDDAAV